MRPKKLTKKLVDAFEKVLNNEEYMLVCTDLELCHLINKQLTEEEQVSYRTFQRYKKLVQEHTYILTHKCEIGNDYEIYQRLYSLWMDARIAQKIKLMKYIREKVSGWQRYRWLLERKFTEFAGEQYNQLPRFSEAYSRTGSDWYWQNREHQDRMRLREKAERMKNNNDNQQQQQAS